MSSSENTKEATKSITLSYENMKKQFIGMNQELSKEKNITVDNNEAIIAISEVQRKIDSIPNVTTKTVVIETKTKAFPKVETTVEMKATGSPTMPFSEYMDYAKDKIQEVGGTVKTMIDFEGFSDSMSQTVAAATASSKFKYGGQTYMDVGLLSNAMKNLGFPSGTFDLGLNMAQKKMFSLGSLIPHYAWEWDRLITNSLSRGGRSYAAGTSYVPETGPYILHKGEEVIPANQSNYYNNARQEFKFIFNGSPRENAREVERILNKRAKYNRSEFAGAMA